MCLKWKGQVLGVVERKKSLVRAKLRRRRKDQGQKPKRHIFFHRSLSRGVTHQRLDKFKIKSLIFFRTSLQTTASQMPITNIAPLLTSITLINQLLEANNGILSNDDAEDDARGLEEGGGGGKMELQEADIAQIKLLHERLGQLMDANQSR